MSVFDPMGNVHPEALAEVVGMDLVIRSGELLPKSSDHRSDHRETFTFGNDGSD